MIEYIFRDANESTLRAFFDNIGLFDVDTHHLWGVVFDGSARFTSLRDTLDWEIRIYCTLISPQPIEEIELGARTPYLTHDIYGAAYPVPSGFVVDFSWEETIEDSVAEKVLDRIMEKARFLGFDLEKIHDEREELSIPWDKIGRSDWDQLAVELWNNNKTAPEISVMIGTKLGYKVKAGTIRNRITDLRNELEKLGLDQLIKYHRIIQGKKLC